MTGLDLLHIASIAVILGHFLSDNANSNNLIMDVANDFPNLSYTEFLLISFLVIGLLKIVVGSILVFKQNLFLSYKKLELRQKLVNVLFSKKQSNDEFKYSLYQRAYSRDVHEVTMGYINPLLYIANEILLFSVIIVTLSFVSLSAIAYIFCLINVSILIYFLCNYFLKQSDDTKVEQTLLSYLNDTMRARKEIKLTDFGLAVRQKMGDNELLSTKILTRRLILMVLPKNLTEVSVISLFVVALFYIQANSNDGDLPLIIGSSAAIAYRLLPSIGRLTASFQLVRLNSFYKNSLINLIRTGDFPSSDASLGALTSFDNLSIKDGCIGPVGKPLINVSDLKILKGEVFGIVGPSGVGKTMLLDTLCTLRPLIAGTYYINDVPISGGLVVQNIFSYLSQDPMIFNDTILFNVTGKNNLSEINLELFEEAVSVSGLNDILTSSGYTLLEVITEAGANLSGGQRQRIALARAIYQNTDVIILDEPTSALDKVSEAKFVEQIKKLKGKKTILIISHSNSFITVCDRVATVRDNCLVEV